MQKKLLGAALALLLSSGFSTVPKAANAEEGTYVGTMLTSPSGKHFSLFKTGQAAKDAAEANRIRVAKRNGTYHEPDLGKKTAEVAEKKGCDKKKDEEKVVKKDEPCKEKAVQKKHPAEVAKKHEVKKELVVEEVEKVASVNYSAVPEKPACCGGDSALLYEKGNPCPKPGQPGYAAGVPCF